MNVIGLRALIVKYSGMRYSSVAMPGLMNEKMYYTYIVASRSHNFYVAMTSEIEIRVQQHKQGALRGTRRNTTAIAWSGWSVIRLLRMLSLVRNSWRVVSCEEDEDMADRA